MKDSERTLPHNLDAERSVLGAILINSSTYIDAVSKLRASDFYRHAHELIFKAMQHLLERADAACDYTMLVEELQCRAQLEEVGGAGYLASLVDGMPRSTNVKHYAAIVHEKAVSRRVIFAANKVVAKAYEQDEPIRDVLADADSSFLELRQGYREGQVSSLATSTTALMDDLAYRVENRGKLTGIDTGFASINEITFGWQPGDLIIVAARPSMGKTAFVLKTLLDGAESPRADGSQRTVLVSSMEMTERQLQYRLLSSISGIQATRLIGGFLGPSGSDDWAQLAAATERMHAASIYIDDRSGRTVTDIRAEARRLQAERGIDLIVVDYVQLMSSVLERRGATRTEELSDTSRKLKILAKELRVPIILVSQLRRISGKPKLDDLRECGSLEQDADQVCFLHRRNHREDGPTEFIIEKNRNGRTGTTMLTFHKDTVTFEDGGQEPTAEEQASDDVTEKQQDRTRKRKGHYARRAAGID